MENNQNAAGTGPDPGTKAELVEDVRGKLLEASAFAVHMFKNKQDPAMLVAAAEAFRAATAGK